MWKCEMRVRYESQHVQVALAPLPGCFSSAPRARRSPLDAATTVYRLATLRVASSPSPMHIRGGLVAATLTCFGVWPSERDPALFLTRMKILNP
jgi:hypothetical protein